VWAGKSERGSRESGECGWERVSEGAERAKEGEGGSEGETETTGEGEKERKRE